MDKWVVYIIVHNNLQVIVNSIHSSFFLNTCFHLFEVYTYEWNFWVTFKFYG